jgi:predicted NBD/HSP70 family sugar kinase
MSGNLITLIKPRVLPPLDDSFMPAVLWNHNFQFNVRNSGGGIPLTIALKRGDTLIKVFKTQVFPPQAKYASLNYFYLERLVKTLLWIYGGPKIIIVGPQEIGEYIKRLYSQEGKRFFDANFMSNIYEKPFSIVACSAEQVVPAVKEKSIPLNRQLKGCRIGFDLGASDRKVSVVIDGKVVFSEEVVWNPSVQTNPNYHYHEIMSMLHRAAARMPRIDAIGGSSAGVYINNRVMAASIFRGISSDLFEKRVKNIFLDIQKEWDVPFKVINDGEVTALAGSMSLKVNAVLGVAMGSSEAGGYVDRKGNITTQLNELAFVPIDFNEQAPIDVWSKDYGCGVQYLSQVAVMRLAERAGIIFSEKQTPAEKLKFVQKLLAKGDSKVAKIFETIGVYLGYAIAHYADFYDLEHILILGRVTSGEGGPIILQKAIQVLQEEFVELFNKISIHLPDESIRRVGQSIAAASLPLVNSEG